MTAKEQVSMARRRLLGFLALQPLALVLLSKLPDSLVHLEDEFIIIGGWVLLKTDLNA